MFCLTDTDVTAKKLYKLNLLCVEELLKLKPADKATLHTDDECPRDVFQPYLEQVKDPSF